MCSVDLKSVDWNKMTPEEFSNLERELQEKKKLLKKSSSSKNKENVIVKLNGNMYYIDHSVYDRLKTMTSQKCKEKLIQKIISENNPVDEI